MDNIRKEINIDFIGYIGLGVTVLLSDLAMCLRTSPTNSEKDFMDTY
jgi:hypothetical protein